MLNYEGGIGVRSDCFCAHPYVKFLLGISPERAKEIEKMILNRDRSLVPGAVRISFGFYNKREEIDHLIRMLKIIINGEYKGRYLLDKERGEYYPEKFEYRFSEYFNLDIP